MALPKWINEALNNELVFIKNKYHYSNDINSFKSLLSVVESPECATLWENCKELTTADSNGQVWLAQTILKVLNASEEEKSNSKEWSDEVIATSVKLINNIRKRPKEKYVAECNYMATQLDEFIEGIKQNFKTAELGAKNTKNDEKVRTGIFAHREHFAKKLMVEYIKRCGQPRPTDVARIINNIKINDIRIHRDITVGNVSRMAQQVIDHNHELIASTTTNLSNKTE